MNNMGRLEESVPLYLDALGFPTDARSRFVILMNLGKVYFALSEADKVLCKQRRHDAVQAWLDALTLEEGGADRAYCAFATANIYLEDGNLSRASDLFQRVLEYDEPATVLSQRAHERLGLTNRYSYTRSEKRA